MNELNLSPEVLARRVFRADVNLHLRATTLLRVLAPFVPKDKTAIDVGAATGHITCWLAEHAERVFAFEAVPPVYEQLKLMDAQFANVRAIHAAVGNKNGPVEIFVDDKRLSNSGFQDLVGGPKITVDGVMLDSLFRTPTMRSMSTPVPIGFIKIDVEGTELDVMKGAAEIIRRDRPNLMVEIYKPFTAVDPRMIFEYLMGASGYRCYYYDPAIPEGLVRVPTMEDGVSAVETKHKVHDGDFLFVAGDYLV